MAHQRKITLAAVVFGSFTIMFSTAGLANSITKCQDSKGQWHYGNHAEQVCARSVVTTLDERGNTRGSIDPPPTKEEYDERIRLQREELRRQREEQLQRIEDERVIKTYASESVILRSRERELSAIEKALSTIRQIREAVELDVEMLRKREQTTENDKLIAERLEALASYDNSIAQNMREKQALEQKFTDILRVFRTSDERLKLNSQ